MYIQHKFPVQYVIFFGYFVFQGEGVKVYLNSFQVKIARAAKEWYAMNFSLLEYTHIYNFWLKFTVE